MLERDKQASECEQKQKQKEANFLSFLQIYVRIGLNPCVMSLFGSNENFEFFRRAKSGSGF